MSEKLERQHTAAWASPTQNTDLPYDFVPVALNDGKPGPTPEAPIWHHGANADQSNLYSGELRCKLTTLSPFFVGNQQVELNQIDPNFKRTIETTPVLNLDNYLTWLQPNERTKARNSVAKKKISFPLMLSENGAVLIPGEGLKGMYRQTFGALMSAPLQYVSDETYSYRPNANPSKNGVVSRSCAGQIVNIDLAKNSIEIKMIRQLGDIEFVSAAAPQVGRVEMSSGGVYRAQTIVSNKSKIQRGPRVCWTDGPGTTLEVDYIYLNYHFSMDINHVYLDMFNDAANIPPVVDPVHPGVLVPILRLAGILTIPPGVVAQYKQTGEHLKDTERGHASRNEPVGTVTLPTLAVNDIIFCECRVNSAGQPVEVISFGHNFRYRWQHLDSVTQQATAFDSGTWQYRRRPELTAHPDEKPIAGNGPQPPGALSAVRNLLGYVTKADDASLGELRNLKDPFDRLAGRVSFNMAMERNATDSNDQRFVNVDNNKGCILFMHPAVKPKASFARGYVPGADGDATWGDGIAMLNVGGATIYRLQNGTSEFAGRKFYPHQLDANGALPAYHYDLAKLLAQQNLAELCRHERQDLEKFLWSDQSGVAVNVSKAGREFGFTVRFKDLRAWELAALASVLDPNLLGEAIRFENQNNQLPDTREFLTDVYTGDFGLKLGRGKAQGMGSVRVDIDANELWRAPQSVIGDWLVFISKHLLPKLDGHDAVVKQWFEVLRLQSGREVRPYLLHRSENNPQSILDYAQSTRNAHANKSRKTDFV